MEVNTDEVNDDNAEDIKGDCPPEGNKPKDGNNGGAAPGVVGPGLVMVGWLFLGVKSKAPIELSDGVGLLACWDDGGRGI